MQEFKFKQGSPSFVSNTKRSIRKQSRCFNDQAWPVRIRSSLAGPKIASCECVLPYVSAMRTPPLLLVGLYVPEKRKSKLLGVHAIILGML